jgi:hypothetical protein
MGAWTGLIWSRIGTVGGLLWIWWWTFGFRKMWGLSWPAEELSGSQEKLCSVEIVSRSTLNVVVFVISVFGQKRQFFFRKWRRQKIWWNLASFHSNLKNIGFRATAWGPDFVFFLYIPIWECKTPGFRVKWFWCWWAAKYSFLPCRRKQ